MIITEQKPFAEVAESLKDRERIFIIGCGSCATAWHTGGEAEVKEMAEKLKAQGKEVVGWFISEEGCDERKVRRELRAHTAEVARANAVLVMSCGAGVQTAAISLGDKMPIYPALNSLFLAHLERLTKADERCVLCGECVLAKTGGLCPITLCPKELLNGPCGGYREGKCEVDPTRDCAWVLIYNRLKSTGEEGKILEINSPKNQSRRTHPRRVDKTPAAAA